MTLYRTLTLLASLILFPLLATADNAQPQPDLSKAPPISKETRENLIHAFDTELVYLRSAFPMGRIGLKLHDGVVTPSGQELEMMMATYGPAAKPGELARISDIRINSRSIHFEINGGPVKKKKWYQRIEVGGNGGGVPLAPSDSNANARGSFVDLIFDRSVPEMTPDQLKQLLRPVFDFNSKSAVEAYLETVPPKVKEAIKAHHVLVGMNHEMVIYAKGRAPTKHREKDGETEYEEWIYGTPPEDVEFVRFVGDEVVRDELMKVGGEKVVRTEKEIDLQKEHPAEAKANEESRPANAPSLKRPGESDQDVNPMGIPDVGRNPAGPAPPQQMPSPPPDQPNPGNPNPTATPNPGSSDPTTQNPPDAVSN